MSRLHKLQLMLRLKNSAKLELNQSSCITAIELAAARSKSDGCTGRRVVSKSRMKLAFRKPVGSGKGFSPQFQNGLKSCPPI